ncbi:MAG: SLOG cluster 4 domain-containing protein [Candidatus Loosdrechtia sp.]|uniref:SLOG cluster 4 domain-containing protein n=1 Tax=Candidatus Loosdrechtia sp. TaxID=3101272 RepID=UPI003A6116D9|nr:MAG: hypothetical protein QY305_00520 [Candidatus Jettenia sp. AMX2]
MPKPVVGVIGAGENASLSDVHNAYKLGELIAREGWVLLTGGRDAGVMRAANEGAKQITGSITIGILPHITSPVAPGVDIAIFTGMHNARNNINVLSSNVVVACGACSAGTISEIALALKAGKTVILLNTDEITNKFFERMKGGCLLFSLSPEDVIAIIKGRGLCR